MMLRDDLSDIFQHLARTSSAEAALSRGVRLACQASKSAAGAIVFDRAPGRRPSCWFRHDPGGVLERSAIDWRLNALGSAPVAEDLCSTNPHGEAGRLLTLPLCCGGREAGWLILVSPQQMNEEVGCQLPAITAALGALLLAVEYDVAVSRTSVLGRDAFRASLSAHIARSGRQGEVFSLLRVTAAGLDGCIADRDPNPWSGVARLGQLLLARLRRTDLIGLMAPDQLAVLLAGTGRLGARIALRRLEVLLSAPEIRGLYRSDEDSSGLSWRVMTFPEDADSALDLCATDGPAQQVRLAAATGRVT